MENVSCPNCGMEYEVTAEQIGMKAKCSSCSDEFVLGQAVKADKMKLKPKTSVESTSDSLGTCPNCFEEVKAGARVCKHCKTSLNIAGTLSECPFCLEEIKPGAMLCRHCGSHLNHPPSSQVKIANHEVRQESDVSRFQYVLLALFFGFFGVHNFVAKRLIMARIQLGIAILNFFAYTVLSSGDVGAFWALIILTGPVSGLIVFIEAIAITKDGYGQKLS